jgi:nitrogen fixation protein NifU and related proteins
MSIADLYQEIVMDHARRPRNFGQLQNATVSAQGENPSCGDEVNIELKISGDQIEDARFGGEGCAICMASASLMTQAIKRRPCECARSLFTEFQNLLEGGEAAATDFKRLGDLAALAGVRDFPQRVSCAMLPWRALQQALQTACSRRE